MKFPTEVLSQHIAILGKTGSGKTYTAKGLVENVLGEGRRVTVEDFKMPAGYSKERPPYVTNGPFHSNNGHEFSNGMHHALEREAPRREAMPVGDSAGRQTPTSGRDETSPIDERRAPAARAHTRQPPGESAPGAAVSGSDVLSGPQGRVVDSIAWWNAFGVGRPTRVQVAHMAGYSPTSGSYRNTLSELRGLELVEDHDGGRLTLSELGRKRAVEIDGAWTVHELHKRIKERLTGPQKKLFDVVISRGKPMSRTEAAEFSGYKATSGSYRNICSELSSLGIVTYPNKTTIAAAPWVMGVRS